MSTGTNQSEEWPSRFRIARRCIKFFGSKWGERDERETRKRRERERAWVRARRIPLAPSNLSLRPLAVNVNGETLIRSDEDDDESRGISFPNGGEIFFWIL